MQPLIVSQQVTQGVADFLRTAFPSTTSGFEGLLERFLADRSNIFKGPYLTLPLPFRKQPNGGAPAFPWLSIRSMCRRLSRNTGASVGSVPIPSRCPPVTNIPIARAAAIRCGATVGACTRCCV